MAGINWFESWDWAGSEREFKRAFELNPGSIENCACYIELLTTIGRFPEAIALAQSSTERDPLSELVAGAYGDALYMARRYEEALAHYQRAITLNPQNADYQIQIALSYLQLGRAPEALKVLEGPRFEWSTWKAMTYAALGRRADATKILGKFTKDAADAYGISAAYLALGDKDAGLEWLTHGFDRREIPVTGVGFDPAFDSVRNDARFVALVARLKLPR